MRTAEGENKLIRGAIFDLDGTLLNTVSALQRSMNLTLQEFGLPELGEQEVKKFVGNGSLNYVIRSLRRFGKDDPALVQAAYRRYLEIFDRNSTFGVRPYDGMPEALETLRKRGICLAVFSNKPQKQVEDNIRACYGETLFAAVRGETPGIPLKPDPAGLYLLLSDLALAPAECLYFGDTGTDMETGTSAGLHTIGVLWGFREEAELKVLHPEMILTDPCEIPGLI